MQFILTSEEFKSLQDRANKGDKALSKEKLQELCTLAARHVPVQEKGWAHGKI